jgi:hypothetical protein
VNADAHERRGKIDFSRPDGFSHFHFSVSSRASIAKEQRDQRRQALRRRQLGRSDLGLLVQLLSRRQQL